MGVRAIHSYRNRVKEVEVDESVQIVGIERLDRLIQAFKMQTRGGNERCLGHECGRCEYARCFGTKRDAIGSFLIGPGDLSGGAVEERLGGGEDALLSGVI